MEENLQITNTHTVDKEGGWLITHWSRTWDTRIPLTQLDEEEAKAQQTLTVAQAELNKIRASKAAIAADTIDIVKN